MSELEILRNLTPPPPVASIEGRTAARDRLMRRASRRHRRRAAHLLVPSVSLAAACTAAALVFTLGGTRAEPASAAAVLRDAAAAARAQEPLELPRGKFLYTASTNAYLSTHAFDGPGFSVLVPHRREIWLDRNGRGWLLQTSGEPRFLSDRDRQRWIEYGRPGLDEGTINVPLGGDRYTERMATVGLPADSDRLWEVLSEQARGHSRGDAQQLFTLVGDALRENYAPPRLRAALYEVAARIAGVELVGDARDALGRRGTAVALDDPVDGTRRTLIFDPETGQLLGEREVALRANRWGYPAGTIVGYAAYERGAVVDRAKERP